jgi:hypothetical protein
VQTVKPYQTIHIQLQAASKPALGEPCNGCGVCCLAEPCPLGMALSGRRTGACDALRWQAGPSIYRCGAITEPEAVLRQALPRWFQWLAPTLAPLLWRLARRWIAAGTGCDSSLEVAQEPKSDRQSSR